MISEDAIEIARLPRVRGVVNYVCNPSTDTAAPLEFYSDEEERSTMQTLPGREVWVRDARLLPTSLDREGFLLASHRSAITDFDGIELDPVRNTRYVEEVNQMLVDVIGASRVLMLGGAKQRFGESATDKLAPLVNAKPARYPHADNTDDSSVALIDMFAAGVADLDPKKYSRCALFNIWRCVSPPPQTCPLAVCDARTIDLTDEVPVIAVTPVLGVGEYRHETTGYLHNPDHRWYYFPDMTVDEVIIFKAHDTDASRARRVAHTAFDDPTCPAEAPARASVEARALALFA